MGALSEPVAAFLANHHGVASRRQLAKLAPGGAQQVDAWVRGGHLRVLHRAVLAAAGSPASAHQTIYAAVLRSGTGARAGPWLSLALMGVENFALTSVNVPDVVVPRPRSVTGVRFSTRATTIPSTDRLKIQGIPALSAARSLIEAGASISEPSLRISIDSALRMGLTSMELLRARAEAFPNHPGAATLRRLFERDDVDTESEGERLLFPLIADFDPPPECQVDDLVPGRRLDFAWRSLLYGLEFDGRAHHVLPTDRDADGLRDLECAEAGVLIHRITVGMLREKPEETLRGIKATFERRKREFLSEV